MTTAQVVETSVTVNNNSPAINLLMTYNICFFIFSIGATIAAVYKTAHFTMPRYASFLWGAGQAFIGFVVSYTRVLATL